MERFEQFRQLVLATPALQERLRPITDPLSFVDLVVQIGEEQGYSFAQQDVEAALSANRKAWLQQRMVS